MSYLQSREPGKEDQQLMNEDKYSNRELRIAVLIDADNISYTYAQAMMEEIACYGNATIKRIYGDWSRSNLNGWRSTLLKYAITPCQQFSYTSGKNATDTAMIIDAMDILYAETADAFCLVSSDSDFTRLAIRLREAGKYVIGIGEQKTPDAFIATCDRFIYLEILSYMHEDLGIESSNPSLAYLKEGTLRDAGTPWSPAPSSNPAPANTPPSPASSSGILTPGTAPGPYPLGQDKLVKLITPRGASPAKVGPSSHDRGGDRQKDRPASRDRYAHTPKPGYQARKTIRTIDASLIRLLSETVTSMGDEMGWAFLGAVGNLLLKRQPSFDSRNYGYQKLSELIDATGCFEVDHREGVGNQKLVYVRLKSLDELADDLEEGEDSQAWAEPQDEPRSPRPAVQDPEAKALDKETLTKEIIATLHLEDWVASLPEGEGREDRAAALRGLASSQVPDETSPSPSEFDSDAQPDPATEQTPKPSSQTDLEESSAGEVGSEASSKALTPTPDSPLSPAPVSPPSSEPGPEPTPSQASAPTPPPHSTSAAEDTAD